VDGMEVLAKGGLRYRDEFVRHKILDLIGDLSLLGRPLAAHVIAIRAGHSLHHGLAEIIKQYI
ncbi:MAG: UDP-3-O-[3-hydroxymyristoyl] N-acetylglucosamine deacetylase, partial [Synergistales bacterium]|nr:UDP-3-O-[3-hydroxymyristoyl] N-acetylglucosamine deacetylase [Synergistales bacterium]